jgi:hypothetical protein
MRTYAVYDRNPTVGLVLGVMAIATLCADIVCVLKRQSDDEADGVIRFMSLDSNAWAKLIYQRASHPLSYLT